MLRALSSSWSALSPLSRAPIVRDTLFRASMSTSSSTFALPPLPYEYNALEPHIDEATMQVHHKRHHQTYISNLNGLISGAASDHLAGTSLEEIQAKCSKLPDTIRTPVVNSAGGHYNHTLFWTILKPNGHSAPPADFRAVIDADFGEFDAMKKQFEDTAAKLFGSGWAWLSVGKDGKLFISSTPNQENPLMEGHVSRHGIPILGLDVWEHAYYLKYQNRRPEYIKAFWNVVNWEQVAANFEAAKDGKPAKIDVPMED